MDPIRLGRSFRALRIRRQWRQLDLAQVVGVSRQLIAKVESGRIDNVQCRTLRRMGEALGASVDVGIRWQGEGLDRLLDAAHAGLVEDVVKRLQQFGWETVVEASYSIRGERGSIDVLATHRPTAMVLVVEVKSVVPDSQAMIHAIDRKARLAREIARERGWACDAAARLLVIGESTTARRRVEILDSTFRSAFPIRGRSVVAWLREPDREMSGLLFVPFATIGSTTNRVTGRLRVRKREDAAKASTPRSPPPRVAYGDRSRPDDPERHRGWPMAIGAGQMIPSATEGGVRANPLRFRPIRRCPGV